MNGTIRRSAAAIAIVVLGVIATPRLAQSAIDPAITEATAAVRAAAGDQPWSGGCRFLVGKRATRTQFQQSH